MIPRKIVFSLSILFVFSQLVFSQVKIFPSEWALGTIEADKSYQFEFKVTNQSEQEVKFTFISTCGCLYVDPPELVLSPMEESSIHLTFDSFDDRGDFEKILIIRSTDPTMAKGFFLVTGFVEGDLINDNLDEAYSTSSKSSGKRLDYYHSPGCRSCTEFIEREIPNLEAEYGIDLDFRTHDITKPEVFESLESILIDRDLSWEKVPIIIFGNSVLQGEEAINTHIKALVLGEPFEDSVGGTASSSSKLLVVPIILAGLLDGVNPCAFTTLIFLISALAVAGKGRKEILVIGVFFTLSVYFTYYLVGAGLFGALRAASSFRWISQLIRWFMTIFLLVFAVLSFLDYLKVRQGRSNEILLQLPKSMKKRIHKSVRTYTRSTALIGSSIIMGFLISLFELGCTGQIYFPTITYMIQTNSGYKGWALLALYNLAFIIPLILVFLVTYGGVGSEKLAILFKKNLGGVKLFTVFLFVLLAILTIIF